MPKNTVEKLSDSRLRIKCECGNMHEVSMLKSGDLEIETIRIAPKVDNKIPKVTPNDKPPKEKKPARFRTLLSPPDEPDDEGDGSDDGEGADE